MSAAVFDLPNTSFTYVDVLKWNELAVKSSCDLKGLKVPLLFADVAFTFADDALTEA